MARIRCELWRALFRFLRITSSYAAILCWPFNALCYGNARLNGVEHIRIGFLLHEVECLLADSRPLSAHKDMAVIIFDMAPRPFVNEGLVLLQALTLLAFIGQIGRAAIFNTFNDLPGIRFKFINGDTVETCIL